MLQLSRSSDSDNDPDTDRDQCGDFIIINLPPGDYFSTYIAELQSSGRSCRFGQDHISFRRNMVSTAPSGSNTSTGSPGFSKETWDIPLPITCR